MDKHINADYSAVFMEQGRLCSTIDNGAVINCVGPGVGRPIVWRAVAPVEHRRLYGVHRRHPNA